MRESTVYPTSTKMGDEMDDITGLNIKTTVPGILRVESDCTHTVKSNGLQMVTRFQCGFVFPVR